ncbi:putative membrane protein, partial [Chlamydia psittaci 84-8471/1]
MYGKVNVNKDL